MSETILEVKHLGKSFGSHDVLRDIDFSVKPKDVTCIIGPSGSGKSTLLRIIAGVYEPEQGCVLFNDCDTYDDPKIRKEIAFVSDEQFYPIGSTIKSVKQLYESMYDFSEAKYQKFLKMFELDEKDSILNLSKGNKRRVALLFALSTEPKYA